jgi:hypothetical protein
MVCNFAVKGAARENGEDRAEQMRMLSPDMAALGNDGIAPREDDVDYVLHDSILPRGSALKFGVRRLVAALFF